MPSASLVRLQQRVLLNARHRVSARPLRPTAVRRRPRVGLHDEERGRLEGVLPGRKPTKTTRILSRGEVTRFGSRSRKAPRMTPMKPDDLAKLMKMLQHPNMPPEARADALIYNVTAAGLD